MYAHKKAKIAYLAHPRTASTSTCAGLRRQKGFTSTTTHHMTPVEAENKLDAPFRGVDFSDSWIVMSTIRNHYDLLRSEFVNTNYHERDEPRITPEVCDRLIDTSIYWRRNLPAPWSQLFYHVPFCTDLLRYERLEDDINEILNKRGLGSVELPSINVTTQTDKTYKDLFTKEGRRWVKYNYGVEMNRYGYAWVEVTK